MRKNNVIKKGIVLGLVVLFLGAGITSVNADRDIIHVYPGPGTPLQDGINEAEPGDIVFVHAGTYNEHSISIEIDDLKLMGENKQSTIINVQSNQGIFIYNNNGITITGFTFMGGEFYHGSIKLFGEGYRIYDNIFRENEAGICIDNYNLNDKTTKIFDNIFTGNDFAIDIISSGSYQDRYIVNEIYDNVFSSNDYGIHMYNVGCAWQNIIRENKFIENTDFGIYMCHGAYNQIYNNDFEYNRIGVYTSYHPDYYRPNEIYHNNFIGNIDAHAKDYSSLGNNDWDMGPEIGGNYWQGHECEGNPSNDPYFIDEYGVDNHPFQDPVNWEDSGGPTCFLSGTQISMADGSTKNIEDVIIGDMVISYDQNKDKLVTAKVTNVFHHKPEEMTEYYLIINDRIEVTPNHLLYINDEWKAAGEAEIGDLLFDIDGSDVPIQSITQVHKKVPTYNLEIETYHVYYADGILAHNDKTPCSADPGNHR